MDERLALVMELGAIKDEFAAFREKASSEREVMEAEFDASVMSAKLIYVLSSFHILFCAFYIHIHVKLIKVPLNLVL